MKISIITITYNSAKTLPNTLQSVLSQTYPHIEHIIVDGDSTDGTKELIEAYAKEVQKGKDECTREVRWVSEKDSGIYNAINKGVEMATGDVIGFVHSDDMLFSSDSIEHIANAFSSSNVDLIYGDLQYCKGDRWCVDGRVMRIILVHLNMVGCLRILQYIASVRCMRKWVCMMSGFIYRLTMI